MMKRKKLKKILRAEFEAAKKFDVDDEKIIAAGLTSFPDDEAEKSPNNPKKRFYFRLAAASVGCLLVLALVIPVAIFYGTPRFDDSPDNDISYCLNNDVEWQQSDLSLLQYGEENAIPVFTTANPKNTTMGTAENFFCIQETFEFVISGAENTLCTETLFFGNKILFPYKNYLTIENTLSWNGMEVRFNVSDRKLIQLYFYDRETKIHYCISIESLVPIEIEDALSLFSKK